jgi:sucrose-phosphate synthase
MVATEDGGPRDILAACKNGLLIDPLNSKAMGEALLSALADANQWRRWSKSGVRGAHKHFSWSAHVNRYLKSSRPAMNQNERRRAFYSVKSRLITADRIVVSDIDNTLIGDRKGCQALLKQLKAAGDRVAFGIATGRSMDLTLDVLKQWRIPTPQLLITGVGSAIHYGSRLVEDRGWERHISYRWHPDALRDAMDELPWVELQPPEGQAEFKISYFVDREQPPKIKEVIRHLRRSNLQARVIFSHQAYLDLLPIRASKGMALRYFALKWGIPLERCLVAGDSGNDEEMLTGNTLGVVVGNHDPELDHLRGDPRIYFAEGCHAWGTVEGIEHYDFFNEIRVPDLDVTSNE